MTATTGSTPAAEHAHAEGIRWPAVVVPIVALDFVTKILAVEYLTPEHVPHPVIGDVVRFTLAYNPGAAFGFHLGAMSRWIFMALTVGILVVLWRLYHQTPPADRAIRLAIATVSGGAIGNLIDRFRSPRGVVDFIDIGVGETRFWTFNVADMAVSVGAALLVYLLWQKDAREAAAARAAEAS